MRISILLCILSASLVARADRAPANTADGRAGKDLRPWFLSKSGISEGAVELIEGPESCQSGTVRILEIDDELTLMLGAHPLVVGIGKSKIESTDRKCQATETAEVTEHKVVGDKKQICDGALIVYHVVVEPIDIGAEKGLLYSRKVSSKDKASIDEVCKYKYVKAEEKIE
jgi:hypothetical protein